jgi:hypothetical protein
MGFCTKSSPIERNVLIMKKEITRQLLTLIHGLIFMAASGAACFVALCARYGVIGNGNAWLLGALCIIIAAYSAYTASKCEGDEQAK